jgi:diguanylate cyclase (GGDEF)-like protein
LIREAPLSTSRVPLNRIRSMRFTCRWLAALGLVLLQSAQAVGVTQEVLDLERNPVETLAAAKAGLAALPALDPQRRDRRLELSLQAMMAAAMVGDRAAFASYLSDARDLGKQLGDSYALAFCRAMEAGVAGESGKQQEAISGAREALQLAQAIQDPLSKVFVGDMAGWALLGGKQFAEAEPLFRRAIDAYVAKGAVLRLATTRAAMGSLYDGLRDPLAAYKERQEAYSLIRRLDAPYLKSYLNWALGQDARQAQDFAKARLHFDESIRESGRLNDLAGVDAAARLGLGLVAVDQAQWPLADRHLQDAQPKLLARGRISLWVVGQAALARTQAALRQGDPEATLAAARGKVAKMTDGGAKLQFLEREAEVMAALGRDAQASQLLRDVLAMQRRMFDQARQTQLSELAVRYDVQKQQVENAELRLRSELAEARLREQSTRQQLLVAVLGLGGAVVGLLSYTLVNQARSRRHFRALALTDALTGAPNRRAILEHLADLIEHGARGYICMLDIDHFKRVNDRHGHPMGDEVLRAFHRACVSVAGNPEGVGRLGGEEWLLIARGADMAGAPTLFERLQAQFPRELPDALPVADRPTFSMGVCALQSGVTVSELLAEADAALYRAKDLGRDRLVVSTCAGPAAAAVVGTGLGAKPAALSG